MIRKLLILGTIVAASGLSLITSPAANADGFNAGRIIDDSVFTNTNSMSPDQIQNFLNSKVTDCDTNGQQISEYGGPDLNGDGKVQRWEWGKTYYNQSTFPCLRDYKVNDGRSAAQVIYDTAMKYSINPQVLIVLLQKEQGLVTDTWPLNVQYRTATGYGCPDTAPCDSTYYGLVNQLDWAGKMFRAIINDSPDWYTPYTLGDNYIQYNPNKDCGGSVVTIENRATQALYNYTPYQPNQATLDAGWGTASCGAYGNFRFFQYFTSWFGAVYANFQPMDSRWLNIKVNTYKLNPHTGTEDTSYVVAANRQVFFNSKIWYNGDWCLRTLGDYSQNKDLCIPFSKLSEFPISFTNYSAPVKKQVTTATYKAELTNNTRYAADGLLPIGRIIDFSGEILIDGKKYLRTTTDASLNKTTAIPADRLTDYTTTTEAIEPIEMTVNQDTNKVLLPGLGDDTYNVSRGTTRTYVDRIKDGANYYYRTSTDADQFMSRGIDFSKLTIVGNAFSQPRWMALSQTTTKTNILTQELDTLTLDKGRQIQFTSKTLHNGQWYYRSEYDTRNLNNLWIPASIITEIPFNDMSSPRNMKVTNDTYWVYPSQQKESSQKVMKNSSFYFTKRIEINGILYLSTTDAIATDPAVAIPYTLLKDI